MAHMWDQRQTWSGLRRQEGSAFLAWLKEDGTLSRKFDDLATALWSLFMRDIRTGLALVEEIGCSASSRAVTCTMTVGWT